MLHSALLLENRTSTSDQETEPLTSLAEAGRKARILFAGGGFPKCTQA